MLTKEEYEALPEKARAAFTEDGDQYVPVKDAKLKQTLDDVDSKYKSAEQRAKELEERLNRYEEIKRQEIEEAKRKALEQAKSKGDVDAAIKQYEERLADLEKRSNESKRQYEERIQKLSGTLKSREKSLIASKLAADLATDIGRDLFTDVVQSRIDVDLETGKPIFLNADGSASSLDLDGFKEELQKDARLKPLLKSGVVTNSPGFLNGSNGIGSASTAKANMGGSREERKAAIRAKFNL